MREQTMLKRLPTLAEPGNAAAFLASYRASAMTATLANTAATAGVRVSDRELAAVPLQHPRLARGVDYPVLPDAA